jgi:hypothetical protein
MSHGEFRGGHDDTVKELSHAAHGREAAVTGEVIHSAAKRERGPRGSPEWSPAHGRWRSFTPQGYPLAMSANRDAGDVNHGGEVTGVELSKLASLSVHCTIEELVQSAWQTMFKLLFLWFSNGNTPSGL